MRVSPSVCLSVRQVLSSFLYTLYTQRYVAGAVTALLVEVNSVTLHLRLLLKMAGATSSAAYRLNKVLNICTFVGVRLATQFYVTWYIAANYPRLDHAAFFLASLMAMNVIMLVYLHRLIRSDFLPRAGGPHADRNGTHNSKKFITD